MSKHLVSYAFLSFLIIGLLSTSCKVKNQVELEYSNLDSLKLVLSVKHSDLMNCDTVILFKAISKHSDYSTFLSNNLVDTIQKEEASSLQKFIVSGDNLKSFKTNRTALHSRYQLVVEQTNKLLADANSNVINKETFLKSYANEKSQVTFLIQKIETELKNYNANIEIFKASLSAVETLISKKNNGLLPTPIKESSSL